VQKKPPTDSPPEPRTPAQKISTTNRVTDGATTMLLTADFRSVGDDRDDEPEMHLNGAPGRFRLY